MILTVETMTYRACWKTNNCAPAPDFLILLVNVKAKILHL